MAVLDHHRAAMPGSGDWRQDWTSMPQASGSDHATLMDGLLKHYQGQGVRGNA
jgi:hypothetical protein